MSGCEAVVLGLIKRGRHVGVSGFSVAPCQLRGLVKLLKPLNWASVPCPHRRRNYTCLAGELQGLNEEVWVKCPILCLNLALCRCWLLLLLGDWLGVWLRQRNIGEVILWLQDWYNWWCRKKEVTRENWFDKEDIFSILGTEEFETLTG